MIQSVIFDIDNTLYDYESANRLAMKALADYAFTHFGWTEEELLQKTDAANREISDTLGKKSAIHNRLIRFQRVLEKEGLPLFPHALNLYHLYWETLMNQAVVFPGVEEALKELKKQGYVLMVGTNMTSVIQFEKMTRFGLLSYFDYIVSSEETDSEKPQDRIFLRCAEKAHCDPSSCVYVGDSLIHDVIGAQNAGMKALWFRPVRETDPIPVPLFHDASGEATQVPSFSDFRELVPLIQQISQESQK